MWRHDMANRNDARTESGRSGRESRQDRGQNQQRGRGAERSDRQEFSGRNQGEPMAAGGREWNGNPDEFEGQDWRSESGDDRSRGMGQQGGSNFGGGPWAGGNGGQ